MHRLVLSLVFCLAWSAPGSTLEKLSLDDMIAKSTAIVRGRISGSSATLRGRSIYTLYTVSISETLKGNASSSLVVATPGGATAGLRQSFSGVPELRTGDEYVMFLWTSRSGLTQIIGLSQGLFTLQQGLGGTLQAARAASTERMVNGQTGAAVADSAETIALPALRARVKSQLAAARSTAQ